MQPYHAPSVSADIFMRMSACVPLCPVKLSTLRIEMTGLAERPLIAVAGMICQYQFGCGKHRHITRAVPVAGACGPDTALSPIGDAIRGMVPRPVIMTKWGPSLKDGNALKVASSTERTANGPGEHDP